MEQVKVMHEASQVAYNASTALQTNVQVNKTLTELLMLFYIRSPTGVFLCLEFRKSSTLLDSS